MGPSTWLQKVQNAGTCRQSWWLRWHKFINSDAGQWARESSWGLESKENKLYMVSEFLKLWDCILEFYTVLMDKIEHRDTYGFEYSKERVSLKALSKEMTVLLE